MKTVQGLGSKRMIYLPYFKLILGAFFTLLAALCLLVVSPLLYVYGALVGIWQLPAVILAVESLAFVLLITAVVVGGAIGTAGLMVKAFSGFGRHRKAKRKRKGLQLWWELTNKVMRGL